MSNSPLEGKRLLLTGVLTPQSIAFAVARTAQEQGADIVLTGFGKSIGLTERSAKRLPRPVDVLELHANDDDQREELAGELKPARVALGRCLHVIAIVTAHAL